MPHVLRVATLEVGDPVPLLVLMKTNDPALHQLVRRSSMYVERGGSAEKPKRS